MLKALYVDDDEDIGTIVELCLDLDGTFETRTVTSGRDALAEAETWNPDVILLDYMMPEMDGPTTFGHLKESGTTEAIPVIFVTAKSMDEDIAMIRDLGASGMISKPFEPTTFAAEVKSLLGQS